LLDLRFHRHLNQLPNSTLDSPASTARMMNKISMPTPIQPSIIPAIAIPRTGCWLKSAPRLVPPDVDNDRIIATPMSFRGRLRYTSRPLKSSAEEAGRLDRKARQERLSVTPTKE
jgi:hypothetical protein